MLFLIPGFIIDQTIRRSTARGSRGQVEAVLTYIAWSSFALTATAPLLTGLPARPLAWAFRLSAALFAVPVLIGVLVVAILWAWGKLREAWPLLDKLGLFTVDPAPTAWDWLFSKRLRHYVRLTLNDGSMVGGYMDSKSYASSYPSQEDLYIQEVWDLDENGWLKAPRPHLPGLWISGEKVRLIEFFNTPQDGKEEQRDGEEPRPPKPR